MKSYVLGFIFNPEMDQVLLIEKNRPEWQRGKLNGVGGKVEPGEEPYEAMIRETLEETGLRLRSPLWTRFAVMKFKDAEVHVFKVIAFNMNEFKSLTDEVVSIENVNDLPATTLPNVKWLLAMAMDPGFDNTLTIHYDEANS